MAIDFEPIKPSGIIDFEPIKRVTPKIDFEPIRKIPIQEPLPAQPLPREEIRRSVEDRRRQQEGLVLPEERVSPERISPTGIPVSRLGIDMRDIRKESDISKEPVVPLRPSTSGMLGIVGTAEIPRGGIRPPGYFIPESLELARDITAATAELGRTAIKTFTLGGVDIADIVPYYRESIEEANISPAPARIAGASIGGVGLYSALFPATVGIGAGIEKVFFATPTVARYIAPAARMAITSGVIGTLRESVRQIKEKKFDPAQLAKVGISSIISGGVIGATFGIPETVPRILAAALAGGTAPSAEKVIMGQKQNLKDNAVGALTMALFSAISAKGVTAAHKQAAFKRARNALKQAAIDAGVPADKAEFEATKFLLKQTDNLTKVNVSMLDKDVARLYKNMPEIVSQIKGRITRGVVPTERPPTPPRAEPPAVPGIPPTEPPVTPAVPAKPPIPGVAPEVPAVTPPPITPVREITDVEELRKIALTDDMTGVKNQRAWNETKKKQVIFRFDGDNVKYINDNIGELAGDDIIKTLAARAEKLNPGEVYRSGVSADDFSSHFDTEEAAEEFGKALTNEMNQGIIVVTDKDGAEYNLQGGISYGYGKDIETANTKLSEHKKTRLQRGERVPRGERPPGLVKITQEPVRGKDIVPGRPKLREPQKKAVEPLTPEELSELEEERKILSKKLTQKKAEQGFVSEDDRDLIRLKQITGRLGKKGGPSRRAKGIIQRKREVLFTKEDRARLKIPVGELTAKQIFEHLETNILKKYEVDPELEGVGVPFQDEKNYKIVYDKEENLKSLEKIKRQAEKLSPEKKVILGADLLNAVKDETGNLIETYRYESVAEGEAIDAFLEPIFKYAKELQKEPAKPAVAKKPPPVPPEKVEPLITEARKYKTAEEFVDAQPKRYIDDIRTFRKEIADETIDDIRGELPDFEPNKDGTITLFHKTTKTAAEDIEESGKFNEGSYFALSEEAAEALAAIKKGEPAIVEVRVDPASISYSSEEAFAEYGLERVGMKWRISDKKIKEIFQIADMTKSQLTNIWKQAQAKPPAVEKVAKKPKFVGLSEKELLAQDKIKPKTVGFGKGRFWLYRDEKGIYTVADNKNEAIREANAALAIREAKPPVVEKRAVEAVKEKEVKYKVTTKEVMDYARAERAALIDEYKAAREMDFIELIIKGELFHPETGEPADTGLIDPTRKYFGNVPFYKSGEWKRLSPIVQRRLFRKGGADFDVVADSIGMTQVEFLEELIKYKPVEKPPGVDPAQVRTFLEDTAEGQAMAKEWREIAAVKGMTVEELRDLIAKRKKVRPIVSKKIQALFEKIRLAKEGEINLGRIISEESLLADIIKGQEVAAQRKFAEGKRAGIYQQKERFAEVITRARERKGQRERIKKMISDIEKIDLSKITPEEAEPLKALLKNVDLVKRQKPTILRLEAYKRFIDTHPDAEVPDYMREKLDRLDKRNMNEITEDDLKTIHNVAMHFLHIHETKLNIRVGRQVRNKIKVLFDSIGEMKPERAVKSTIVRSYKGKWARLANVGQLIKDTFGIRSEHYDLIIETLAGPNSTMDKVLYQGVKDGINDQYRLRHSWIQLFQNTLGPEQFKKKYKIKNINKWLNEEVPVAGFYLSRNERMALYRHSLNKDNTRSLLEVGFGFRTSEDPYKIYRISKRDLRAIVDNLDDAELEFCIKPFELLEESIVKKLSSVFYEKNNFPMPVERNYYPKNVMTSGMSLEAQDEKAIEQFRQKEALRVGMSKGFLKRRKRVAVPIYVNGFTYDVNNMIFHASAYSGLELPLSNASKLLYDRTFRAEIYRRYGKQTWVEIEKGLRDIVGDWMSYTTTEQLAMKLKNNLSTAILGISWAIPKQTLSLALYSVYIKPQYLISGAADYAFTRNAVEKRHSLYSPERVERMEGGYSRDVADVFKSQAQRGIYRGTGPIKEKLMGGVKLFDRVAVDLGMQAAVSQALHEFKEGKLSYWVQQALDIKDSDIAGLSPTEKMQKAYKFADWTTERSQPMFSPEHRSSLSRGATVEKLATQFTAFTNQMLNLGRRLWREADRTKDPARYANYLHFLFLLYVVNTGGVFLIHKLRDYIYKRDQRHKRGLLLQFGEAIMDTMLSLNYFIRDLGYSVKSKVKYGTFRGADYSLPILEVPNKMTDIAANGFGYFSERNRYKRKKMAIDFIDDSIALTLMLNGLPYQTPKRIIQKQFLKK